MSTATTSDAAEPIPSLVEPWFERTEYLDRLRRVQAEAKRRGLDGVLLFQPESVTWLTGFFRVKSSLYLRKPRSILERISSRVAQSLRRLHHFSLPRGTGRSDAFCRRRSHPPSPRSPGPAAYLWAALIARIYDVFPLVCPNCGAELRLIAFLTEPAPVKHILSHLGLPSEPPPLAAARGPPLDGLDQSPNFDLTDPAPAPQDHFDQSVSW